MPTYKDLIWDIYEDAEAVAGAVVKAVISHAKQSITQRGEFHLVLAGGTTPRQAYEQLARKNIDYSHWYFYYGDERCLPTSDEERNNVMAQQAWLDHIELRPEQHLAIPAELGAEQGAKKYLATIGKDRIFDLVLLGMGEDGHTASLFPDHPWQTDAKMLAVHGSPKPPADRVSMGPALLQAAHARLMIITGENKQEAVKQWREKEKDLPIKIIAQPADRIVIDKAAYGS